MHPTPFFRGVLLLATLAAASGTALAQTATEAVHALAQQCVVVQSPATGKYAERYAGLLGEQRYRIETKSLAAASRFFMKPAALGTFLLRDAGGRYLSSRVAALEIAQADADTGSEWRLSAAPNGSGFRYRLENAATGAPLSHVYTGGFLGLQVKTESHFNLQPRPAAECASFPEIPLNVTAQGYANPHDALRTRPDQIRGYIDGHTHLTAEEFGGGIAIAGHTFHRWGVAHALKDCKEIHGSDGKLDLLGVAVGGYGSHDTAGWPAFRRWPAWDTSVTHTGYYHRWVERAHLSGLRLMVVYTVENEVLCNLNKALALGKPPAKSCDTQDSVRRQVENLYALQDYVDAQAGGPGRGFFRIVLSPAEARQVIANGKLAVVIGIEASETFNCSDRNACDAVKLKSRLASYRAMGVRSIFPNHKFDTQLGGATLSTPSLDIMNVGNFIANGHYFGVTACDADTKGSTLTSGPIDIDPAKILDAYDTLGPVAKAAVDLAVLGAEQAVNVFGPHYDPAVANGNACNSRALTPLGTVLINAMIDEKMLIDVDHQSTSMTAAVLDIAERRGYSGVVASHGDTDDNRIDPSEPHYNLARLARLGGHVSVIGRNTRRFPEVATPGFKAMSRAADERGYVAGIGIGTDVNGLIRMPMPLASDPAQPALPYPFTNEFGVTFERQVSGNRTFDLNSDGMAHYGMLPDLMAHYALWMRANGQQHIYESLMNSAESYLQMWERASR
jgi:microsomal dipeptidase-like Zn-dependent dipeptidase